MSCASAWDVLPTILTFRRGFSNSLATLVKVFSVDHGRTEADKRLRPPAPGKRQPALHSGLLRRPPAVLGLRHRLLLHRPRPGLPHHVRLPPNTSLGTSCNELEADRDLRGLILSVQCVARLVYRLDLYNSLTPSVAVFSSSIASSSAVSSAVSSAAPSASSLPEDAGFVGVLNTLMVQMANVALSGQIASNN